MFRLLAIKGHDQGNYLVEGRVYLGLQLQKIKVQSDREAAVIVAGAEAKGPNFKTQTGSKKSKL